MVEFQSYQLLYIEHQNQRLYVEMIQMAEGRQLCWVRPVALQYLSTELSSVDLSPNHYPFDDLRQAPDLLCPANLLQSAIDVEVIPILMELGEAKNLIDIDRLAHQRLREFINRLWKA